MTKEITNLPASVRAKLLNIAKDTNRPFTEVLQFYAIERFLYRLSKSKYANKFILKGALMFSVWQVHDRRTTLDIDFLARFDNQVESIEKVVKEVCAEPVVADGLIFDSQTVQGNKIKEEADYSGVRVKLLGFLERARIPMQIDFGFGDIIYPKAESIEYPVILAFPVPHLKGYTPESVVSEKFEAMIKLGMLNSRMKDFYDIWNMIHQFDFIGSKLAEALKRTFKHRKTNLPWDKPLFSKEIYEDNSDRQILWKSFLKKAEINHAPENLSTVVEDIENFLIKPLEAVKEDKEFLGLWKAPGPWSIKGIDIAT
jgi:hypothetical protein